MTTGAKEQVGRLLALVPLIRREGDMRLEDAAARLGVPPEQLVADLRVLIYCGWPGWMPGDLIEVDLDALDGDSVIRIHNADYLQAPLRLSAAEASAITVALRTLRESADGDTLESLDRALAKIETVAEDGQPAAHVDVHVPPGQRENAALRGRLAQAIADGRQVRLTYYVPARDENTERTVDPVELVDSQGMGYLQAWCHQADGRRLFRLDRIVADEVLETAVDVHPDLEPVDLGDGLFRPEEGSPLVTLRLAPQARWVAEYYPVEAVRERRGNRLEIDLRVADPRWLVRLLLRLAPYAEVVGPQEYADAFTVAAQQALRLYGGTDA
ncbi:helix-turn-helix transcriptional regulator [Nocardioides jensenii]|uniref:helix-turn-helix transcriptional regulator n=1 Tax=Nocardioides jensenii TaxID=1843 RepID=UPI0008352648|nr:WYL domain-containing protein [Nocardioides jensenii]